DHAAARGKALAIEHYRRRHELVLREHAGRSAGPAVVGGEQCHIMLAALDPGMAAGSDEAGSSGDAHGQTPTLASPAASSKPSMRLAHWIIWPAAPFTRLSSAASASTR